MRVLVVGAGLAGLVAARRLQDEDVEVRVLEARDRVGGRVWSHQLDNGTVVELGGEWIDSSHRAVRALAADLGLRMVDTRQDFLTRDLIGTEAIPDAEHSRIARRLFDVIEIIGAADLEMMSVAELLDTIPEAGPAMTVLRSRLEGTFGVALTDVSAAELDAEFGLTQATSYMRVDGGNDRLAREIASKLDVRPSTRVESIGQTSKRVAASVRHGLEEADFAVVAVPLPVLRSSGFLESPESPLQAAMEAIGIGVAAKVAVATIDEPPMFRRQEADIPAWYWTGGGSDGSTRRGVTGFAGTRRGVATLMSELEARLTRAAPEATLSGSPVVADWGADPHAGCSYSALGPGQRGLLAEFRRPWGRILFAGEHVNGSGTIDGAIRSGIDAADLLLEMA